MQEYNFVCGRCQLLFTKKSDFLYHAACKCTNSVLFWKNQYKKSPRNNLNPWKEVRMKYSSILALAALCGTLCVSAAEKPFRQTYHLDPAKVKANAERVAADLKDKPQWQKTILTYYAVPAMSDIRRLSDVFPTDGEACGTLNVIAAQGEYEPASFVIYPRKNVDKFELKVTDLTSKKGGKIPASEVDLKLIKIWYQSGQAWCGFFADCLTRTLTPEVLVNDENLIQVHPETQDNYVRYDNRDGSTSYQWMTANMMVVNYSQDNQAQQGLISDAATLQPVVLNKDEFKQFFATVHVPAKTADGIYTGEIQFIADGKKVGAAPLKVRVLPFELPRPRTNYNLNKEFYFCFYGTVIRKPEVLRNLAKHNALHPMGFPFINVFEPKNFSADIKMAKEAGLDTDILFCGAQAADVASNTPPTGDQAKKLRELKRIIQRSAELCKKELGHTNFLSYGIDEAGPSLIRKERAAWALAHDAGGKVMVSTGAWRKLLFALDYMIVPGMPSPNRILEMNLFHEANPDSLTGWYGNPHSGPENPDYNRRIHGIMAYKGNYDVSANYTWWRNNWNDMATPYEEGLRNIVLVLGSRDGVLDTLEWEGIREGADDIRYATKLKLLATEAMKHKSGDVQLLGRRAMSYLAYFDAEREDLNAFRLETINYIIQLQNALNGGK